jgi:hypothetical protein
MRQHKHRYELLLRQNISCTRNEILAVRYVRGYELSCSIKDNGHFYYQKDHNPQESTVPSNSTEYHCNIKQ